MRAIPYLLPLLAAALVQPALAGTLYKWKDANGKVHYSDIAPPPSTAEVQEKQYRQSVVESPEAKTNRLAGLKQPVTLYISDCGNFCDMAEKLLKERGIRYSSKDPQANPQALAELEKLTGHRTIPMLMIGDQKLEGFNARKWNEALDQAGYAKAPAPVAAPQTGKP